MTASPAPRRLHRLRPLATALLVAALASACSILPKPEPVDVYLLPATRTPPAASPALALALRVAKPETSLHLAGQRIVVLPEGDRVSVYKGANWSDPAPLLVRNRLLDAFQGDGRIAALSSDDRSLHADLELDSDLRAFHSEYRDGRPEAVVRLDARLVAPASLRILASRRFEVRHPAASADVKDVVRAFGAAADALSAEVVAWTLENAAAPAAR